MAAAAAQPRATSARASAAEAAKAAKAAAIPIGRHTAAVGTKIEVSFSTGNAVGVVTALKGCVATPPAALTLQLRMCLTLCLSAGRKKMDVHFDVDDSDFLVVPGQHQYRSL